MIYYKSEEEIDLVRESSLLVAKTHAEIARHIKPGISSLELDLLAEEFIRDNGGVPAFKGYNGFPCTLCVSPNEQVVHGIPNKDILDEGTILSWHASFEIQQNEAMAEMYPDYASFLNNMNHRTIDLKEPFADETVIDPGFKGSASIKDVLPVFKPELSYSDLDIQKGDAASRLWKEVTIEKPNSSNSNKVYSDLIDYCKRDTLAMVEIHRELEKMVK